MKAKKNVVLRGVVLASILGGLSACSQQGAPEPKEAVVEDLPVFELVERGNFPLAAHLESSDIAAGKHGFDELFEAGGDLFHTAFNGLDGVGIARRGDGSEVMRFGTPGPAGPGAQSCGGCHGFPVESSAGLAHGHVAQDPDGDGAPPFNVRSVTSIFGNGLLQLLAQEMTVELQAQRAEAADAAVAAPGEKVRRELSSKGTSFGALSAMASSDGEVSFDLSALEGVDPDLVVRPLGWKGNLVTVRAFTVGPANGGLGMQPDELVWKNPASAEDPDLDGDGVGRELSVGDITAMTLYGAAQETPAELARLAALGFAAAPSAEQQAMVERGREVFTRIGCAECHRPELRLGQTLFEEPTAAGNGNYYDHDLAQRDPDYDPDRPVRFDLLTDAEPPRVEAHPEGGAVVRLYGDLKRHAMGRQLADPGGPTAAITSDFSPLEVDGEVVLIAPDSFLTAELWGVGNTGPWLHDGRAGSLREAILWHGEDEPVAVGAAGRSEAQASRDAFVVLSEEERTSLIGFLKSLITYSPPADS
jgi:hypothetical protein